MRGREAIECQRGVGVCNLAIRVPSRSCGRHACGSDRTWRGFFDADNSCVL